ncbi:hypothetical protein K6L12_04395 [Vibrio parahaemolyticus]|nr:hypothetical protein [Vibrio parahaemolyticus]MBO0186766.1 hypothetical protein [Vibrio parahaemolyticus]MBO0218259.1 hypothetical protein [Vibrio parahaemolyticus]MBY4624009.1 hypothetical protein [Vibrio parahaemolyticus]HCH0879249.1 hypothetical protein [Vibrio parahaemolyticus]
MGKVVGYTLNQWRYLKRYVENGLYPIDYHRGEREFCLVAVSRKLGCSAIYASGANASAVLFSIMLTCRANNVEPHAFLRHVLIE